MDEFLSQLREQPRPEFAHELAERLAHADRLPAHRLRQHGRVRSIGLACAGLSLLAALSWSSLLHTHNSEPLGTHHPDAQLVALLLPVTFHTRMASANSLNASLPEAGTAVDTLLVAPATPLSHHH